MMALCSARVVLVTMWHLLHPGVLYLCGLVFLAVGLKKWGIDMERMLDRTGCEG